MESRGWQTKVLLIRESRPFVAMDCILLAFLSALMLFIVISKTWPQFWYPGYFIQACPVKLLSLFVSNEASPSRPRASQDLEVLIELLVGMGPAGCSNHQSADQQTMRRRSRNLQLVPVPRDYP